MFPISTTSQAIQLRSPVSDKILNIWPEVLKEAGYLVSVGSSCPNLDEADRKLGTVVVPQRRTGSLQISGCRDADDYIFRLVGSELRFPVSRQFLAFGMQFQNSVVSEAALAVFQVTFSDELIDVISRHCCAFTPDNIGIDRNQLVERIFARHPRLLLPGKMSQSSRLKAHFGGSDRFGRYVALSQKGAAWDAWRKSCDYSTFAAEIAGIGGREIEILKS